MTPLLPLTLLYDAACPVCAVEMDHLRARTTVAQLNFIDISDPGFDAARFGVTLSELDAEIHGVYADGSAIHGVEVLRIAYELAGLGWVMRPTGWAAVAPLADLAYRLFARHRRAISKAAAPLIHAIRVIRAGRARRTVERMRACRGDASAAGHACRLSAVGIPAATPRRPS